MKIKNKKEDSSSKNKEEKRKKEKKKKLSLRMNEEKKGGYLKLLSGMKNEWKWLAKYIKVYRLPIFFYIIIGVFATLMSLGTSVVSKYLIDAVVSRLDDRLFRYGAAVIALAVFNIVFSAITAWISANVTTKTNNDIKADIFSNMMLSSWKDISVYHSGELLNRIEGDVSVISSGVISFVPSLVTRALQFIGSLVIVLVYDRTMAVLALISAPFLFFSSRFLVKTMRKFNKQTREMNGKVLSFSEEALQNIQVLKAFDLTRDYIKNFCELLKTYRTVRLNYEKFSILTTLFLSLLGTLVSYTCYGWGVYRLWQGAISYGTMTLFLSIASNLSSSFSSLASLVPTAISIATSAGRVMEITAFTKEDDEDREKALEMKKRAKEERINLEAKDLFFAYKEGDGNVLSGIDFNVSSGETIAFIGASGEGKTTILRLILGLVKPSGGSITLISENGAALSISDSTRRLCAYVPQEKSIFSGTIAENLRIVKSDATDEELEEVLEKCEMLSFVSSLPLGLETPVGEKGVNLSQGQAQRISIARALLRDSEILLLDEATSALDVETEEHVLKNIMTDNPQRLCILTTHRESMLRYADRIYKVTPDGKLT